MPQPPNMKKNNNLSNTEFTISEFVAFDSNKIGKEANIKIPATIQIRPKK